MNETILNYQIVCFIPLDYTKCGQDREKKRLCFAI